MANKIKTPNRKTKRHRKTCGGYNANEPVSITSSLLNPTTTTATRKSARKIANTKSNSYKNKNIQRKNKK